MRGASFKFVFYLCMSSTESYLKTCSPKNDIFYKANIGCVTFFEEKAGRGMQQDIFNYNGGTEETALKEKPITTPRSSSFLCLGKQKECNEP